MAGSKREWFVRIYRDELAHAAIDISDVLITPSTFVKIGRIWRIVLFAPHLSAVSALTERNFMILERPLPSVVESPLWPVLAEQISVERIAAIVLACGDGIRTAARADDPPMLVRTYSSTDL
ncbi:hypothetical protein V8E36_009687 [Tilletia maclaganii]